MGEFVLNNYTEVKAIATALQTKHPKLEPGPDRGPGFFFGPREMADRGATPTGQIAANAAARTDRSAITASAA
jgi:hypothetical protein